MGPSWISVPQTKNGALGKNRQIAKISEKGVASPTPTLFEGQQYKGSRIVKATFKKLEERHFLSSRIPESYSNQEVWIYRSRGHNREPHVKSQSIFNKDSHSVQ